MQWFVLRLQTRARCPIRYGNRSIAGNARSLDNKLHAIGHVIEQSDAGAHDLGTDGKAQLIEQSLLDQRTNKSRASGDLYRLAWGCLQFRNSAPEVALEDHGRTP